MAFCGYRGVDTSNAWDIWIYPDERTAEPPGNVHIARTLDDATLAHLEQGGKALLLADGGTVSGDVAFGFSPAIWNTAWTNGQAPHTLGITLDPDYPVFEGFPTEDHTDWQWWDLIGWPRARAGAMVLDDLPLSIEPIVRPIDTWYCSRRLASMFECRVGEGGCSSRRWIWRPISMNVPPYAGFAPG